MHYRIIYSTDMFHRRVTHGDRKKKAGRETKQFAVETPIAISWHDSGVVRHFFSFFLDLEHYFLRTAINLFSTAVQLKP